MSDLLFLPADFLARVKTCSEIIAARQNHPIYSVEACVERFDEEYKEFQAAKHKIDELPDMLYYLAYMRNIAGDLWYSNVHIYICIQIFGSAMQASGYTLEQLIAACDVKYGRRASGEPKDIPTEHVLMEEAVERIKGNVQ